jgi:Family of unknown function (DUF5691)
MSAWQDLVTASLIGTERAAVPAIPAPGSSTPAGALADPAALVLDHAALLTAARRGGRPPGRPGPGAGTGVAADPETAPAVSQAAGRRLARILGGEHAELLPEWLTVATGRGRRVPAVLLPALLHRARRPAAADPELRWLAAAAGGARARWLAGLNPEWSFVLAYTPAGEDAWRLGDAARRRGYLAALRARDPGAARELIAASWDAAGRYERVMFLDMIADQLSLADEFLLEGALDDRHDGVRTAAAGLLAALPGSGLSRRMAGRARECLWLDPGLPDARLAVSPPGGCSAAMRRDGITPVADARAALGVNRGLLLLEMIARAPVRTWTDGFGMRPAEILDLPLGSWAPVLFAGWSRAAISQRDQEWMAALTNLALTRGLPAWLVAAGPGGVSGPGTLRLLARHVDPALIGAGPAAGVAGPVGAAVRDALDTLRFRYQMLKELAHDDGAG